MKTSTIIGVVVAVIIIAGVWYWWSWGGMQTLVPAPAQQGTDTNTPSPALMSQYVDGNLLLGSDSNATLGKYLIAYNGMTLYMYTKDTAGVSNCSGQCAVSWPPYTIASRSALANLQAGITGKVGTITRADGTMQVTYNNEPLYFW